MPPVSTSETYPPIPGMSFTGQAGSHGPVETDANDPKPNNLFIGMNSRCQRDPDHPRQIGAEVRLRQQQHAGVEAAMMDDGVLGITGRIEHLEFRAPFQRLDRELTAV